jgi:hypothetical protein
MFSEYIGAALERTVYKTIEDEDTIFVYAGASGAHGLR